MGKLVPAPTPGGRIRLVIQSFSELVIFGAWSSLIPVMIMILLLIEIGQVVFVVIPRFRSLKRSPPV
jgi:hypothetical protein